MLIKTLLIASITALSFAAVQPAMAVPQHLHRHAAWSHRSGAGHHGHGHYHGHHHYHRGRHAKS